MFGEEERNVGSDSALSVITACEGVIWQSVFVESTEGNM